MARSYNYFLAFSPPSEPRDRLANLRNCLQPVTPVRDEHLHMTLLGIAHLAERHPAVGKFVTRALVGRRYHACPIKLEYLVARPEIAVLKPRGRQAALQGLRASLKLAMLAAGAPARWSKSFQPHVTLGRKLHFDERRLLSPVCWHADEMVLIESWHGATHHEIVGRWPLLPPLQSNFDFMSDLEFRRGAGPDRKRMDPLFQEVRQRIVHCPLALEPA